MKQVLSMFYTPTAQKSRAMQVRAPKKKQRGIALIMVLIITTILSAIAADLENDSRVNLRAAANSRDQLQAYFHARSAVELELFVLRLQGTVQDALKNFLPIPLFEFSGVLVSSDTMKGIFNRGETPKDERPKTDSFFDRSFGNFEGSFWIEEVSDENRKLNVNLHLGRRCRNLLHPFLVALIDDPKYDPLFESLGESRNPIRSRLEVISNITDWVDADEQIDPVCYVTQDQSNQGDEQSRYDNLPYGARYKPKNKPLLSLAELRLVPTINDAFMRLFADQLTVWTVNEGINLKTASTQQLRAVTRVLAPSFSFEQEEQFQKFLDEWLILSATPGGQITKEVFRTLLQASGIAVDQALYNLYQSQLRTDDVPSVYKITAIGRVNDASSEITVVWQDTRSRELKPDQFFYWREE